ncbi:Mce associated membrane protein [soil metagenome]
MPVETDATTEEVTDATQPTESDATEVESDETVADEAAADEVVADEAVVVEKPGINWGRVLAYGILPGLALILGLAAGFLKWQDSSVRDAQTASTQSMAVAKDSTIKLLSYRPDTVEKDLTAARDLLTGEFRDSYTQLTNDVVIPGSKQQQISAVASVPAIASVSADPNRAVVLVFVNQTVIVGNDAPTATASSVQVTLDKVGDRWLISKFDPI